MQDFRKLNIYPVQRYISNGVYRKAIEYCIKIYTFSAKLPSDEKYGLISQIRRVAVSIPLNEMLTCLELNAELKLVKDRIETEDLTNEGIALSKIIYSFSKKLGTQNLQLKT